jgi:uncharacterized membrane protein YdfJ with MMPL/SSD domain
LICNAIEKSGKTLGKDVALCLDVASSSIFDEEKKVYKLRTEKRDVYARVTSQIIHAIEQTGGIITAAAIILAGSLGALMLSGNLLLREMGFAFCFSILVDALVVGTYLVPAVMSLMGKWNWYNPIKRLRRTPTQPEQTESKE